MLSPRVSYRSLVDAATWRLGRLEFQSEGRRHDVVLAARTLGGADARERTEASCTESDAAKAPDENSEAMTAHGNGNGLAETRVQSESDDFLGNQCVNFNDQPPGFMTVKWEWWRWRSDLGQWVLCNYSPDWMYNEITNHYMVRQKVFLSNQTCGPAWYGTSAGASSGMEGRAVGGVAGSGRAIIGSRLNREERRHEDDLS